MHRPEMWGVLQFTRLSAKQPVAVRPIPGKPARDVLLEIYYAQRDFFEAHQHWASTLEELGWKVALPAGVEDLSLAMTAEGYECSVRFQDGSNLGSWRIRQDRRLACDLEPAPVSNRAAR